MRKWPLFPLIERYVLRQMVSPLLITLAVALLLLVVERLLRLLDLVLAVQGSLKVMVELLTFLVPHYMEMALPLGLFLAVLVTFDRFHRDRELDALHAAGVSPVRLMAAPMIAAMVVALLAFAVFGFLQPHGRYAYRAAIFDVKSASALALLQEGIFTVIEDAMVLVGELSADRGVVRKVFVHIEEEDETSVVITAPQGRIVGAHGPVPVVDLFHGIRMRVAAEDVYRTTPASTSVLAFGSLRSAIGSNEASDFRPRGKDERELTLPQLWRRAANPPVGAEPNPIVAELHGRLVRIATVLVLPVLAVAFGHARQARLQPFKFPAGMLVLVVYYQLVQAIETLVGSGHTGSFALWVPFACLVAGSLAAFTVTASGLPSRRLALAGGTSRDGTTPAGATPGDGRP